MTTRALSRWSAAGLVLGPVAWAAATQANYILPDVVCGKSTVPVLATALGLALVAWLGGALSIMAWKRAGWDLEQDASGGRARHLLAGVGALVGVLFGLVIVMQGMAAFVLSGCERW
jgi:hypothetical protein